MDKKLLREILRFVEQNSNLSFNHEQADILEKFPGVEYNVLDEQLISVKKDGLIDAHRHSGGWFIQGLTTAGMDRLESPTIPEALSEQNEILKQQIEVIRQTSERAEFRAEEANKIAVGAKRWSAAAVLVALICAALARFESLLEFWCSWVR